MKPWVIICTACLLALAGCQQDMPAFEDDAPYYFDLPAHALPMPVPEDNQMTQQRVKLGKKLFFDKRLSRDLSLSCATCHQPEKAFANNEKIATGIDDREGMRNVPTLMNTGFHSRFNWDGGTISLETQVLVPIQSHNELDMSLDGITKRLKNDPQYAQLAREAYESEFNNLVLVKALAAFQRSLTSFNSPFDAYYYDNKSTAISEKAKRGWELFMSEKTNCSSCHEPPLFTTNQFANIGLYETYADSGLERVSLNEADLGKFKTPTLRNVEKTAPYMHDGSIGTLEDVVGHFNKGGQSHVNKSALVRPLNLNEREQSELVAFLKSLTDRSLQE